MACACAGLSSWRRGNAGLQDIEWAVEQLPGFKSGDIAAFAITGPSGEETPLAYVGLAFLKRVPKARRCASAQQQM